MFNKTQYIENTMGNISKYCADNEKAILLSEHITIGLDKNIIPNLLVIGNSGSGKTCNVIIPNLLNLSPNTSCIIQDEDNKLYSNKSIIDKYKNSYSIKYLNLKKIESTIHYNPFNYIETDNDIKLLVDCLLTNIANNKTHENSFWKLSKSILVQSIFMMVQYYNEEINLDKSMRSVMALLQGLNSDDYLTNSIFEKIEIDHPGNKTCMLYKKFKKNTKEECKNIIESLLLEMNCFNNETVLDFFDDDKLEIEKITETNTILYINHDIHNKLSYLITNMIEVQVMNLLADNKMLGNNRLLYISSEMAQFNKFIDSDLLFLATKSKRLSYIAGTQSIQNLEHAKPSSIDSVVSILDNIVFLGSPEVQTIEYIIDYATKIALRYENTLEEAAIRRRLFEKIIHMSNSECLCIVKNTYKFDTKIQDSYA